MAWLDDLFGYIWLVVWIFFNVMCIFMRRRILQKNRSKEIVRLVDAQGEKTLKESDGIQEIYDAQGEKVTAPG